MASTEENMARILAVENSFGRSGKPLKKPGRVLVGEGCLIKLCKRNPQPRVFFLFNDILVYGSIIVNGRWYMGQHVFPLEDILVEDLEDSILMKNQWLIRTPSKSFYVSAASPQEKHEWITHIEECRAKRVQENGSGPLEEFAPSWIPDSASAICMRCGDNFTFTQRRHHCRQCGYLVCGYCSSKRFVIANISCTPVRVCQVCFQILESEASIRQCGDSKEDAAKLQQEVEQQTTFYKAGFTTQNNKPAKNQTFSAIKIKDAFYGFYEAQKRGRTAK